jgi:protein-disulfide isomerase
MSSQSDQDRRKNRRSARRAAAEKQAKRRRQFTIGGVAVVAIVVALALIIVPQLGGSSGFGTIQVADAHPASLPSNGKVLGDPNAPVKIVEYGNYQ